MPKETDTTAEDAFSLLSDETRLTILRELAAAADEDFTPRSEPVSYAELMDRVGLGDSGNFNYHLNALRDRFVAKAEEGYRIRRSGLKIVRALRAGNLTEQGSLEPTPVDECCPYCGASIEVAVDDGWLLIVCTDCKGLFGGMDSVPDGLFIAYEVSPAVRRGRSIEELFRAVLVSAQQSARLGIEGICSECIGRVETELRLCSEHDPGDGRICDACGRATPAFVRGECTACGLVQVSPPAYAVWNHEPTRRRLHNEGVADEWSAWNRTIEPLTWGCTVERDEQTLLHYLVPVEEGNETLRMTVDENLVVRSIE